MEVMRYVCSCYHLLAVELRLLRVCPIVPSDRGSIHESGGTGGVRPSDCVQFPTSAQTRDATCVRDCTLDMPSAMSFASGTEDRRGRLSSAAWRLRSRDA